MPDLPAGTVTFLFTDIEGSTRLLRRLGSRYVEVVDRHALLVRDACAAHGGREVGTEGDAFFVAFARAGDAVAAALDAQRALAAEPWPDGAGVRVRMGMHTGEPIVGASDYVGLAVHRAARICAVGQGGQVLVSRATRGLLEDDLAAGIAFRDLGECRLKDFDRPDHLYEVRAADLPTDVPLPPPAARGGAGGALPRPPNRTIGREQDLAAVGRRLRAASVRLLTLTGPGGVGKTRLALESARAVRADFADGVHFVSLAPLQGPEDVPAAIVMTLGIAVLPGESAGQAAERFLAAKHLLLVTDNFEHVLDAAPFVGDLLAGCPALTVLATSREPLALQAEQCHPVPPLALPARPTSRDADAPAPTAAVELFCERARAHDPDVDLVDGSAAAVAEICRGLDGLPLAIELAAARCGLLTPREIAERLQEALGDLGAGPRDAPARHRTLRATVDWSHELLSDAERQCFARFAVFAGGATVHAAETITHAGLDTLDGLVTKSLLVRDRRPRGPTRLGMLDTIRAHARERLSSAAEADAVRGDHCRYYLALAQRHGTDRALLGEGARDHLAVLDAEVDNLHAAVGWAIGQADAELALALIAALGRYWVQRDRYADGLSWVDQALSLPGAAAHPSLHVRALGTRATCLWALGRAAEQPAVLAALEAVARRLGDPLTLAQALRRRVDHQVYAERLDVADALADEALHWARIAGDDWEIAHASSGKAVAAASITELRDRVDRAARLLTDVGNVHELATLLTSAAYAALCLGSERDAADFAARAAPVVRTLDSRREPMINSGNLGLAALLNGETDAAARAFREELTLCRDLVIRPVVFEGLRGLAAVAVLEGDPERAARLVGAADAHRYDKPEDPVDARLDETFFEPTRTRSGNQAWDAAARDGATLSFEDAIAYAIDEPPA